MLYIPYPFKRCTKCGREFPPTTEFFFRHSKDKSGLKTHCKQCGKANSHRWLVEHPEQAHESRLKRYAQHREERIAYSREWVDNNRERVSKWRKRYYAENADEVRERARNWYAEHTDRGRARSRRWAKEHPDRRKTHHRKRRAQLKHSVGTHTYGDELAQLKRQKQKCYYCREKIVGDQWHPDHVVPLSRGGSDSLDNIVIACPKCNLSKNDKLPHEWPKGGRLL